ncbi:acyltransferase [Mycolicibacterium sp. GF69]|uniref:acyltransferase family protein n=1 Tax=Mycolicibacterium sp. GF69 TaxID=2267251 RepID=UPI000DCE319D|nr:acyltransferase family protein [Mycolicibacterium sp. GF69]RAV13499.1 acyltransferase [Mycolicibacterium sp. GF69]
MPAGQSPPKQGFRPDIEGLRAVAVLGVVLFHAGVPGVGGGYVGVDVFFVISGFLITGLLWREVAAADTVRLRRFYGARARRLLPAAATVAVVTALASVVLLPPLQARTVMGDGVASALYVGNYRFMLQGDYFFNEMPLSPFLHYWSLGVEEQFYLVWPTLIIGTAWFIRRRRSRTDATWTEGHHRRVRPPQRPYVVVLALVAAVSFAASLWATHWLPLVAFYSLPTRAWELAVGGLVALTAGQWHRLSPTLLAIAGWGGLTLIVLGYIELSETTPFPGTAALLPVIGTALVIGAGCAAHPSGCGRLLALSPMRAVGRVSYSWYLWHWPVLLLAPAMLGHSLGLAGRLLAALVSGVLAVLTLVLIENPLRFAAPVRRSPVGSLALGGAATAIAVCVCVVLLVAMPIPAGRGAPAAPPIVTASQKPPGPNIDSYDAAVQHSFAQVQAAVERSANLKAVPSNLVPPLAEAAEPSATFLEGCMRKLFEIQHPECATGDVASKTTVALVGDSGAAMWGPAFQQVAEEQRWRLETLTKAGCPFIDLPINFPELRREFTECEQWRDQIMDRLRADPPELVVVSMWRGYGGAWGITAYDQAWIDSLTHQVQHLRDTGAKVLVLGPIPFSGSVVPICLSGHLDNAMACSPPTSRAVNKAGIADEMTATKAGGGQYADLTELFCDAERCPVIVGNILVYPDGKHVTREYSRLLAPAIGALAERELARN